MDKKTIKLMLLERFRNNGGRLTLGQILVAPFQASYRRIICELKKDGAVFKLTKDKESPTKNLYVMVRPPFWDNKTVDKPEGEVDAPGGKIMLEIEADVSRAEVEPSGQLKLI